MSFRNKSGSIVARGLSAAVCVALSFALAPPAAHAGESGMTGWAFCTTYAPYSSAYVAGDPVYASEVFHVDGSKTPDLGTTWRNFLKQKYGWAKSANCSIATGNTGQATQLRDSARFMEQAGPKLVRTGWKVGITAGTISTTPTPTQSTAANPTAPGQGSFMQGGIMYWVCTWFTTNSTVYISDAFSASNKLGPTELVPPFTNFVIAKFGATPHAGSASCVYKFKEADAQTYLKQRIAQPPSGMHVVQTGWKYGMTGSGGATPPAHAAAAPGPTMVPGPQAQAATAVAAQSAPVPPVTTNITLRLIDAVNSGTDPAGKHYRAVVTQAATAGSVQIPVNTLGAVTLVQQQPGSFAAQLVSLKLNGQDVPVTSTAVTATSMTQQVTKKLSGFLSTIGKQAGSAPASAGINTAGNHVALPPGTSLTFSAAVPQAAAPAANP